ncbi:MAG: asparagine synthase (glutamine-hydrolyzing) [Clostridia bacterium]|nr:asparagine synthase (glutamine-hydrolyzing) [Clostridia bacterium]
MCSICGIIDFETKGNLNTQILENMNSTMKSRGPDDNGFLSCQFAAFAHNRLAVMDVEKGKQPMTRTFDGNTYTIIYNGEIYNFRELRADLEKEGITFSTNCDTEVVLYSYIVYGEECPKHLNGIFAFAVIDEKENKVFMARDRFGVKPFFYAKVGSSLLIASEIKAILKHPKIKPQIDREGLWQLLFLSPCTVNGSGVFKDISEIKPAFCGSFSKKGLRLYRYWSLKPEDTEISSLDAALHTKELLLDAVNRQLVSDVPLAVLLSGGLDSSVVSAISSKNYRSQGKVLSTYSFEYEGNKKNFKSSLFQPQGDDDFALWTAQKLGTNHTVLTAPTKEVSARLFDAVKARDIPGQADIDSSLLYFCSKIKENHTVVLSGECADEIFGGYPWFYKEEMLYSDFFPWIHSPLARANLFKDDIVRIKDGYSYASALYKASLNECPLTGEETPDMKTARQATWLSVNWFMTSLLERKDRMSMYSGLEVRVPFSDHRILEFVYNVPWSIKFENGVEKALLRKAMTDYLPEKILYRKKSPYPKTHNPKYEKAVKKELLRRIKSGGALAEMLDKKSLNSFLHGENTTWFGQLMSRPQLIAWLLQLDMWFEIYDAWLIT